MASLFQIRRDSGSVDHITKHLKAGELYDNQLLRTLELGVLDSSSVTLTKLNETNSGSFRVSGDISASGNLFISGNARIVGNLTFGDSDALDTVTVVASLSSSLIPNTNNSFDLGNTTTYWKNAYISSITGSLSGSVSGIGNISLYSASVDSRLDYLEGPFSTSVDSRMDLLEAAMSGSKRLYVSPEGTDTTGSVPHGTEHNPYKTIKAAVQSLGSADYTNTKRYTIFVGSGEYTEQNPIVVPPGVAIVGDTLRTVRLTASNPTKDFFHVHDSNYFYGLRFLDLKHPAFAFSFPSSTATGSISAGGVSSIGVVHSMTGYTDGNNQDLGIIIEGPDASGSIATATANVVGGVITQINVVSGGTNYVNGEKPYISIPAPVAQRPLITTSPYIQNCSSITGPFNTSGAKVVQALPYSESAFNIDEQGAGGGIRIDGNLVHPSSPLESFVADAFTQVNQGGPGHLVINKGYAQFVSCFTTFCTYGFKVANGGFANISNSVIDFGKKGLVSKTYYPQSYNTALANETKYSSVTGFEITLAGAGYTGSEAGVELSLPDIIGGTPASASAVVSVLGTISSVYITNSGSGYTSEPIVTIDPPTGVGTQITATADAFISGVTQMKMILSNTTQSIEISSNMILSGSNYLVTNVQTGSSISEKLITTFPNPPQIVSGSNVYFHKLSNISTGGLVMEYGGSGVTYNALPKFGGVPDRTKEIVEIAPGRIFYSTVDNIGNLKIGEYFAVDQLTGEVTIDARNFNLSGINQIGPFRRNGISVGEVLREVSDSVTLVNSQGVVGSDTVPTQYAVYGYVNNYTSSTNDRLDELETTASTHETRIDNLELISASYNSYTQSTNQFTASVTQSLDAIHSYTASLKTAFTASGQNVTIYGNLTVQGTQTAIESTTLNVKDINITLASGSTDSAAANGAGINIDGANVTMSWSDTNQRIQLNKDFAVTGSISSSTLVGVGNVTLFSASISSSIGTLNNTSASFYNFSASQYNSDSSSFNTRITANSASAWGAFQSASTYSGSFYTTISASKAEYTSFSASQYINDSSSFDSRTDLLETTASYLNTTFSTSVDSRLDALETDSGSQESRIVALELTSQSLNQYTASVSTSVGLLQTFSSSQYINDSSSFNTRISASTLTFNDTTGQTGIDFTQVGTQVSAIASGLTTGSSVQFSNITASYVSASGTIYAVTIVYNTLVGSGGPVLEYETNGTLGNILIKGATSKSIQVVDSIKFIGLAQNGGDQYSATGLQLTGSLHVTQDITASGNLYVSGTIFTYELHTIIESSSVIFSTGSNTFGDQQSDIFNITGSLYQTGSTSFSELTGSLFAFSSSLNSRIGIVDVTTLSASIYQTDATQSNNILINSASAAGAFASASSYSGSFSTILNTLAGNITIAQNSANGAYASASAYSGSSYTRDANQDTNITNTSASAWGAFQSASSYSGSIYTTINTVIANVTTAQNSANGAYASASAYSASAKLSYATTGSNEFNGNQTITGSLYVTGDVVAYSTSDERLKDNIELISNPIEKVQQLRGVEFDWNDNSLFKAGRHDYGVIAQDVQKVLPELVKETHTGFLGVDYDKIIGLLIEVVKEQEKRIKNLENK